MIMSKSAHANLIGNYLICSLCLLVKKVEEKIQLPIDHVNKTRGWTLEQLQKLLQKQGIT